MFMAHAVQGGGPIGDPGDPILFRSMPELFPQARQAYEQVFRHRITHFQCDEEYHLVTVGHASEVAWRHSLWHDAKSASWLLVWWAVTAYPKDSSATELPASAWVEFNDTVLDSRHCIFPEETLHDEYLPLHALLTQLGKALASDFHWATQKPYNDPEFLHKVF